MADRSGASQQARSSDSETTEHAAVDTTGAETDADLDDVDALLDEIDEVLEENAEDFVRNYVQKGGQ